MRLVGSRKYFSSSSSVLFLIVEILKMDSSIMATVQYKSAVLKAYGIVPMTDCFPNSCNSSVHLKRNQSTLPIYHFALSRRTETEKHESGEENSTNADETQIPSVTMKQHTRSFPTDNTERMKITKNDVLKAHGIIS